MLGKILYIMLSVVIGMIVFMGATLTVQSNHLTNVMQSAINEKDYETLTRLFVDYVNIEPLAYNDTDDGSIRIFQSGRVFEIEDAEHGPENRTYYRFEARHSFTILAFNFDGGARFDTSFVDNQYGVNNRGIRFIGEDDSQFTFNSRPGNAHENLEYTGVSSIEYGSSLFVMGDSNFFFATISMDAVETELGDIINAVQFIDGRDQIVLSIDDFAFNFEEKNATDNWSNDFYDLFAEFKETLNAIVTNPEPEVVREFNEFAADWLERFAETGYHQSFRQNEIFGFWVNFRIFLATGVYVLIATILGIFIFRKLKKNKDIDYRRAI